MRIGILADVHEDVEALTVALALLRGEDVDRIVVLGDLFDTGQRIAETVALLREAEVIGVWGNHDLGLCYEPGEWVRARYAGPVLDFMGTLHGRLELEGCLFVHGLPHWDETEPTVFYLAPKLEAAEARADSFRAMPCPVAFVGHFHRWLAATPLGILGWDGGAPLTLQSGQQYLIVVAAVCDGWCATFDTAEGLLTPWPLGTPPLTNGGVPRG